MKYWFMEAKIVICVCHSPEKGSKYHLETVQTTFIEINNYCREIPYSREQKHVSISDTPMLLIEINSISNMGRQK